MTANWRLLTEGWARRVTLDVVLKVAARDDDIRPNTARRIRFCIPRSCHTEAMKKDKHAARETAPEHVTIDGLEGDKARVELPDGTTIDWDRASLPEGAREGDLIRVTGEGSEQRLEIDHAATQAAQADAQSKLDALNGEALSASEIDL